MKNSSLPSILLVFMLLFVVALILFNINQTRNILVGQSDEFQDDARYNPGNLIDTDLGMIEGQEQAVPVQNSNVGAEKMNDEAESISQSKEEIMAILKNAPAIELTSADGVAKGKAAMAVRDNKTYFKIAAINMPAVAANQQLSGWLVNENEPDKNIYTGAMSYEASTSNATLLFAADEDLSKYKKVIVTLESVNHSSEPAPMNVLEGKFDDSVNFLVNAEKQNPEIQETKQRDMQSLIKSLGGGSADPSSVLNKDALQGKTMEDLLNSLKK